MSAVKTTLAINVAKSYVGTQGNVCGTALIHGSMDNANS